MNVTSLVAAAVQYTLPRYAEEIARNVAGWLPEDCTEDQFYCAIRHRMTNFAMPCSDPAAMARAMYRAMRLALRTADRWSAGATGAEEENS